MKLILFKEFYDKIRDIQQEDKSLYCEMKLKDISIASISGKIELCYFEDDIFSINLQNEELKISIPSIRKIYIKQNNGTIVIIFKDGVEYIIDTI